MLLTIDFETRAIIDIKKQGAFVYAAHPLTEVMCLSVMVDDHPPVYWMPEKFYVKINPANIGYSRITTFELNELFRQRKGWIIAHNAEFEYLIWGNKSERYGFTPRLLSLETLQDTMASLAYHALPLNLDQAGQALNLTEKKDSHGHAVMLKLSKPRKPWKVERENDPDWLTKYYWHEKREDIEDLVRYCCQDVRTTKAIYNTIGPLPPKEHKIWVMNERINLRGVPVDSKSIEHIVSSIENYELELSRRFMHVTKNQITTPRSYVALKDWVNAQLPYNVTSIDKENTEKLLKDKSLPVNVKEALKIKSELSKSSVSKLASMLERRSIDDRIRCCLIYHAASTGRFASWGFQWHNQPRDSYNPEDYLNVVELFLKDDLEALKIFWDDPYFCASRCIRGSIYAPPGKEFICMDFSSIEGVGLAYLAGEEWVLEAFRKKESMYKHAAAMIFGIKYDDVNKEQRQVGKVSELALGYQGGIGAYASMAKSYKLNLETLPALILPRATQEELNGVNGKNGAKDLAKMYVHLNPKTMSLNAAVACDVIKRKWRAARPAIVNYWYSIQQCAYSALQNPGQMFEFRGIKFCVLDDYLKCKLPSGRFLHYYKPQVKAQDTQFGKKAVITYMGMKVIEEKTGRQWARIFTHGGKLVENIVQAFCRDLLTDAMLRHEQAGYKIVLHVHDEDLAEIDEGTGDLKEFIRIAEIVPPYAQGMPIKAEGWIGKRYRK